MCCGSNSVISDLSPQLAARAIPTPVRSIRTAIVANAKIATPHTHVKQVSLKATASDVALDKHRG